MASLQFTEKAEGTVLAAIELAKSHSHIQTAPLHFAAALLDEAPGAGGAAGLFASVVSRAVGDPQALQRALAKAVVRLPSQDPPGDAELGPAAHRLLREAQAAMRTQNDIYVAQDHLVLALVAVKDPAVDAAFKEAGVKPDALKAAVQALRAGKRVDTRSADADGFQTLAKYAVDLTAAAADGKLDPVIGRADQLRRLLRILSRKTKNNAVLIGEPGVGKTAIAEALAHRIINGDVPATFLGAKLFSLDLGALLAGASHKGEHEERVRSVLDECEKSETPIILFIDEMHLLLASSGGIDAGQILKPSLARGRLRCIGATTLNEYKKTIEKDTALDRRFGQVLVEEPSVPEAIGILRGLRERYELYHAVTIADAAIVAACTLAHRYLPHRRLPDSALDCLDEAAAGVKLDRDSMPEEVDKLERARLALEVEIAALERETKPAWDGKRKHAALDPANAQATADRLEAARKELGALDDQLTPLKAAHEAERSRSSEIQAVKTRVDQVKVKIERAERERDLATAADLRHFALPDLTARLQELEALKAQEDASSPKDIVTADRIADVIARWSGVPVAKLKATESQRLLKLEKIIEREIVGQPEAARKVSEAIRLSRSGLTAAQRPIASFLLVGPSGTGKTQLTKVLARFLFDNEDAIVRIDCSEFSERHTVSRLVGAPAGYVGFDEGGQLTESIKRRPYSIVLFDEIEKAHKSFQQLLLQILDAGRLTDGQGRLVNLTNTVIVFTSNLGASAVASAPDGPLAPAVKDEVNAALRAHFLPEFLGRLDETIIFNRLGAAEVRNIVDLRLREISQRLATNGKTLTLAVSDVAKDWLAAHGVSPQYGARPLARVIQGAVLVPLSRMLLDGSIRDDAGETARVELDEKRNALYVVPNHEAALDAGARDDMDVDDDLEIEEMD